MSTVKFVPLTPAQFECCINRKNNTGNSTEAAFDVMVKGMSYKEAAELNSVSKSTVTTRVSIIMRKHREFLAAYSNQGQ